MKYHKGTYTRGRWSRKRNRFRDEEIIVDLLNDLVAANIGVIDVYQVAAEHVQDRANVARLQSYARQHKLFVQQLSNQILGQKGKPVTTADGSTVVKRSWLTLREAGLIKEGLLLRKVEQDTRAVLETYGLAMSIQLPHEVRDLIYKQKSEMNQSYEKLTALKMA